MKKMRQEKEKGLPLAKNHFKKIILKLIKIRLKIK